MPDKDDHFRRHSTPTRDEFQVPILLMETKHLRRFSHLTTRNVMVLLLVALSIAAFFWNLGRISSNIHLESQSIMPAAQATAHKAVNLKSRPPALTLIPPSVDQSPHLPCVPAFTQSVKDDPNIPDSKKVELLYNISLLTYGNRDRWISLLNPLVIQEPHQLRQVRSVCPVGSIALVAITHGLIVNIQEWLLYHLLLGVQHVILFDHSVPGSQEQHSLHKAIQIFVENGYLTHRFINVIDQTPLYNQAVRDYEGKYDWIIFIDQDEYLTLHQDKCLPSFLSNYTEFAAVVIRWRMRGFLGVPMHDVRRTHFEQYLYNTLAGTPWMKTIAQPKYIEKMTTHEPGAFRDGKIAVSPLKKKFDFHQPSFQDEFAVAEVRHFFMGDLHYALFEKVCGLNNERVTLRSGRMDNFKKSFYQGAAQKETDFPLPQIYKDFKKLFFQDKEVSP